MLAACPVHGCKLLYECPECRKPLTWTRRALLHCCKEAPFAAARTGPADERAVELARLFRLEISRRGRRDPSRECRERIGALTGEEVILLILLAGLRPEDGGSDKAIFRARSDGKYVETLVLRAADTLLDWPTGMSGFSAAWDAAKGPGATRGAVKDFGYLYHRLQTLLSGPAFAFFRDEVWEQKVARSPLSSLAHKRTKRMSTALSAKAVVKTYGVGKHWLEEWDGLRHP